MKNNHTKSIYTVSLHLVLRNNLRRFIQRLPSLYTFAVSLASNRHIMRGKFIYATKGKR